MTIDDFFKTTGGPHREVLRQIDQILLNAHPAMEIKKKYGIPMYVMRKNIAYLDVQKGAPIIGFVYGIHLNDVNHLLDFTGRKQIGHLSLLNLDDSKIDDLLTVLYSAIDFDLNKK